MISTFTYISYLETCHTALIFYCSLTYSVLATGPGSPDWNSILESPIVEDVSPSLSKSQSLDIIVHQESIPEVNLASAQVPHWAARRQPSRTPTAIRQREKLAKFKSENYAGYLAFRERENQRIRESRANYTKERKERDRNQLLNSQRRFAERQKHAFKVPENVESLKKRRRSNAIASSTYRRRLADDVLSGRASERRIKLYYDRKNRKKESTKLYRARQKAIKEASKLPKTTRPDNMR